MFEGSYTWAKAIDTARAIRTATTSWASRGVSSVDVPHRLVFSGVYELPVGRGRQIGAGPCRVLLDAVDRRLAGRTVSSRLQSGDPLGISANGTAALFSEASRANSNGGNPILDGDAHGRLDRWFDTSVFSQPAPFTLGNVSPLVTNLRNHYINNLDLSVFKHFQITEKLRVQFRAEAFNSLNRVRFSSPTRMSMAARISER